MTKPPLFSREHFSVNENSLLPLKNLPQSSQNKQGFVCTKGFPAKNTAWAIRILGLACLICHGSAADCTTSDEGDSSTPAWRYVVNFGLIIVLIVLSGLFSGLTLGLLGLDKIGLQIVIDGGNKDLAKHAKKIQPLRENGNLLLCTLLLGNVAVNALLSILMADLTSGLVGFFLSTIFIVIFGEIIPQASCSRYALQIGGRVTGLVKVIIIIMYVITKPLSMVLDWALGDEIGTIHSRRELMKLLQIHVEHGSLDAESGNVVEGALKYKDMVVEEVMTSLEDCFMLPVEEVLDFRTISSIFQSGFSRVPVYEGSPNDVVGVILTKDLIFIDPEDATPVRHFINIFGRQILVAYPDQKLGEVLAMFKKGQGHMALVRKVNNDGPGDPYYEGMGLITLEDIVEEILGDEIVDETDVFVDVDDKTSRVVRETQFDYSKLTLLDDKLGRDATLGPEEVVAIRTYLMANVPEFQAPTKDGSPLSAEAVEYILRNSTVLEIEGQEEAAGGAPGALSARGAPGGGGGGKGAEPAPEEFLYRRGEVAAAAALVLSGKLLVRAGRDGFRAEAGPWTALAAGALTAATPQGFAPDFDAYAGAEPVRLLRVPRQVYREGLRPPADRPLEPFEQRQRQRAGRAAAALGPGGGGPGRPPSGPSVHDLARQHVDAFRNKGGARPLGAQTPGRPAALSRGASVTAGGVGGGGTQARASSRSGERAVTFGGDAEGGGGGGGARSAPPGSAGGEEAKTEEVQQGTDDGPAMRQITQVSTTDGAFRRITAIFNRGPKEEEGSGQHQNGISDADNV